MGRQLTLRSPSRRFMSTPDIAHRQHIITSKPPVQEKKRIMEDELSPKSGKKVTTNSIKWQRNCSDKLDYRIPWKKSERWQRTYVARWKECKKK